MVADMLPKAGKGTLWRMPLTAVKGVVRLSPEPFEQMIIPPDVLDKARAKKTASAS